MTNQSSSFTVNSAVGPTSPAGVLVDLPTETVGILQSSKLPQATEAAKGAAEIATQVEADAGTDDLRFVTPLKLRNAPRYTGNTIWVDAVNGDDETGINGREDRPFLSPAAALAVAVDGDLVLLRPGSYLLSVGITIPTGVTLRGEDARQCQLKYTGALAATMVTLGTRGLLDSVDLLSQPSAAVLVTGVKITVASGVCFRINTNPNSTGDHVGCEITATGVASPGKARLNNCFAPETRAFINGRLMSLYDAADADGPLQVLAGDGVWREAQVKSFGVQPLRRVEFSPVGIRSNFRLHYQATTSHRWILEDGSETTELKTGDRVRIIPRHIEGGGEFDLGFVHGVVFGDGTRHTYYPKRHFVRLCGKKVCHLDRLERHPYYRSTTRHPSSDFEPIVTFVLPEGVDTWKKVPVDETSLDYQAGFLAGWLATDGSQRESGSLVLGSQNALALDWVVERAPLLGFCVVGRNLDTTMETTFGRMSAMVGRVTLRNQPVSYSVRSICDDGRQEEVYCIIEPVTKQFVLEGGLPTGNCALLGFGAGEALRVSGSGTFLVSRCNLEGSLGARLMAGSTIFEMTGLGGTIGLQVQSGASALMAENCSVSTYDIQTGGSISLVAESFPRNKVDVVDPAVTDDESVGFAAGSRWINTVRSAHYICVDATEGAAVWTYTGQSPAAENETAVNEVSTSSAAYTLISGMTISPGVGSYLASFSADARTDTVGRPAGYRINSGGVDQGTERHVPHTEYSPVYVVALVTVNGSQAIEARFKRDIGAPGPSAYTKDRTLVVLRVA